MVIIKLEGGLGNQLLQYLFGISLARKNNTRVYFDISEYTQGRGIRKLALLDLTLPGNYLSCIKVFDQSKRSVKIRKIRLHSGAMPLTDRLHLLRELPVIYEKHEGSLEDLSRVLSGYLIGYWVSFFLWGDPKALINEINQIFDIVESKRGAKAQQPLIDIDASWEAVHIRRGDYLNPEHINWYGICSTEFFVSAVKRLGKEKLLFFSDDPSTVEDNFSYLSQVINVSASLNNEIDEFLLMRKCANLVISNSTFSYVAALFASFTAPDHRIVAPAPWFQWGNRTPPILDSWITLGRSSGIALRGIHNQTDLPTASAMLCDVSSLSEIQERLTMLSQQTTHVRQVFINADFEASLIASKLVSPQFSPQIIFIPTTEKKDFLLNAFPRITADYFVILDSDIRWSVTQLASDLTLARETNSDMVASPFFIDTTSFGTALSTPVNMIEIENSIDLRKQLLLIVMGGHGTTLTRSAALNPVDGDSVSKIALFGEHVTIQCRERARYPLNFFRSGEIEERRSALVNAKLWATTQPESSKHMESMFDDVLAINSRFEDNVATHVFHTIQD